MTSIESRIPAVTVSKLTPEISPEDALISVVPTFFALARPSEPLALEIVAMSSSPDDHVTESVRSCFELSVKMPVALNCCRLPFGMLGSDGVTSIVSRVAAFTVSVVDPEIPSSVAWIVVLPTALAVASPFPLSAFEIVATSSSEENHVTSVVRSRVELSVYVPVAPNCFCVPFAMLWLGGVTSMDTRIAAVTVSLVCPEIESEVARIVVSPTPIPVACPSEPGAFEIVATPSLDDAQVTSEVMSCVELSVYVPVALNCCFPPLAMLGSAGVTSMVDRTAALTVSVVEPESAPKAAVMVVTPTALEVASP